MSINQMFSPSDFKSKLFLGTIKKQPLAGDIRNTLYVGGIGSGNSRAMRDSFVLNYTGSVDTVYFILSPYNESSIDYNFLENKVDAKLINTPKQSHKLIDNLYYEMTSRLKKLAQLQEASIMRANERSELNYYCHRIMVLISGLDDLLSDEAVKYSSNSERVGTTAWKLMKLLKDGHSSGITFLATIRRGTGDAIPASLRQFFYHQLLFRSDVSSSTAMNLPQAEKITENDRGLAAFNSEFTQFPTFNYDEIINLMERKKDVHINSPSLVAKSDLINNLVKDLESNLSRHLDLDIDQVKLGQINFNQIPSIFANLGYELIEVNPAFDVDFLVKKDGKTTSVFVMASGRGDQSRRLDRVILSSELCNADDLIVVNLNNGRLKPPIDIKVIDLEDMRHIALILLEKDSLKKLGIYDRLASSIRI